MAKPIEQPVTQPNGEAWREETKTTHPAFAQISASRVSGSANLYGSDFRHQHYMTIRVKRSELHRSLNRDWYFGREEIIEVALSESQWATFVSAPNHGDGVPCTLERFNGAMVPGLPDPASRADQFRSEMLEDLHNAIERVNRTIAKIDELGLPKGKAATLKDEMSGLLQDLKSKLPFVAKQFEEHVEDTVEKAKQEIHGYMTGVIQRAGIKALSEEQMPLQIDVDED